MLSARILRQQGVEVLDVFVEKMHNLQLTNRPASVTMLFADNNLSAIFFVKLALKLLFYIYEYSLHKKYFRGMKLQ